MGSQDLNYFTCTLGQAALWKKQQSTQQPNEFATVLGLIDDQGRDIPDEPAIGFADFSEDRERGGAQSGETSVSLRLQVTFRELKDLSHAASETLADCLRQSLDHEARGTVGLMCASSLNFVFTWLGLMRLGYKVFLLAPQLEEKAIEHLCSTAGADTIFVDRMYHDKVEGLRETLRILDIPSYDSSVTSSDNPYQQVATCSKTKDVAYLRHTSGTSSGLPKPIYQSHWGAVGILPRLPPTGKRPATFSTTPLYHGGLADCFRAWAAGAMIWFFPEGVAPVTGANVVKAVECARRQNTGTVNVGYFTSVPYVLQMLSESDEGIRLLRSMDLVGVGGAALPAAVGDGLVERDVKLVSRMGSAECGFLLSSDRDYAQDKEWQFLRPAASVVSENILAFEPCGDGSGLSELVARPGWPLLAKTNRPDGSYATADLFEPHPSIPDAWRYHSRSDAQITLANGKKFDPSPLEGTILAASARCLRDVLVFGGGRDYPGALLFPMDGHASEFEVIDAVWPAIQKLNKESQSHARLTKAMLVVVLPGAEGEKALPKSSKGTIMRRQAEEQYGNLIEKAYEGGSRGTSHHVSSDDDVPSAIAETFAQVLGHYLDPSQDLYGQGVDSIACIQIRKAIERDLLPEGSCPLPINIIYDCGTINELVDHVLRVRQRGPSQDVSGGKGRGRNQEQQPDADLALMRDLVRQNSDFSDLAFCPRTASGGGGTTIILTGATGALGAHIAHYLLQDPSIRKIYCLLRAQTPFAAHERVSKALSKRGLTGLEAWDETHWLEGRIVCLPSELHRPDLGLAPRFLESIKAARPAVVIHSAWTVNFSLRIGSFGQHFAATRNLIRLAAEAGARFYFVSSTAAVVNKTSSSSSGSIAETGSVDPADAAPLGYSRSKWVAENICAAAHERYISEARGNQNPISVIRVGQLFANHLGIWNESEAYPLMLSTASFTGCLPDLGDAPLNWLPVELAAQAVMEIALGRRGDGSSAPSRSNCKELREGDDEDGIPVYHVLNPHRQPTWREMLDMISSSGGSGGQQPQSAVSFETVSPSVWVKKLETSLSSGTSGHSSQGLLDLWKGKYSEEQPQSRGGGADSGSGGAGSASDGVQGIPAKKSGPVFELSRTEAASRAMRDIQPLDEARILRMWKWLQESSGLCH
ncbi:L-aminoadipate-semialdehyde dehydrogenase [Apiospora rasikravindrae]|uniref:L-aminoadipate-semialdehyde dehydrogenase n=1 Tax=Apiospora rasikravindrae TaxID=990691 RepID=A0ABR1SW41_9PEZI